MSEPPDTQPSQPLSPVELEGRILRNTGWVALSLGLKQVASLLALLVLARLLDPADFGLVALAWSVLAFVEQVQETGVGSALIHRRTDIEEAAASTLVYSPLAGLVAYLVVFAAAPLLARFLHAPDLVEVLRVMALILVLRGIAVVPGAILERSLDFRSRTIAELVASFAQIAVFLVAAFSGLGVWSLVLGYLTAGVVEASLYWFFVPWRPSVRKARRRILLELMRYGRFVGATSLLSVVSNTVDRVVIARVLGTTSVGLYTVAFRLADFPNSVIGHIMGRTMFSAYSMLQHDLDAFRHAYVRNLQRVALLAVPLSVTLVIAAEPIVLGLVGEQWLPAVPVLRILGVYGLIKSFGSMSAEALKGLGVPHWNLVFGVSYMVVVIPSLILLTRRLDLTGAAISMLLAIVAAAVPAVAVTARKVHLSAAELGRTLAPFLLCSAILAVTLVALLPASQSLRPFGALVLLGSVGLVVYVAATAMFARDILVPMWLSLRGEPDEEPLQEAGRP